MKPKKLSNEFVAKLGFGCGRIVGGASLKESTELIQTALDLGIMHFDVAPSYGLGTAEEALGQILAGDTNIKIATKVGIAKPANGNSLSIMRKHFGPLIKKSNSLKKIALSLLSKNSARGVFATTEMEKTFETSLKLLRREYVDILLLHEPSIKDINSETIQFCEFQKETNRVKFIGIGTNHSYDPMYESFGSILQHKIGSQQQYQDDTKLHYLHGILKESSLIFKTYLNNDYLLIDELFKKLNWDINNELFWAPTVIALVMHRNSNAKILLSFSDPKKMQLTLKNAETIFIELIKSKSTNIKI